MPSVRPPPEEGLISMVRKFAPKMGCTKEVDTRDASGIVSDSNDDCPEFGTETKINYGRAV